MRCILLEEKSLVYATEVTPTKCVDICVYSKTSGDVLSSFMWRPPGSPALPLNVNHRLTCAPSRWHEIKTLTQNPQIAWKMIRVLMGLLPGSGVWEESEGMGSFFLENWKYFSFSSQSLFGSHLISIISRTQLSNYSYLHAKIDYNLLSLITSFLLACNCGKILLTIHCYPPYPQKSCRYLPEFWRCLVLTSLHVWFQINYSCWERFFFFLALILA